jgi:hypothetical protein
LRSEHEYCVHVLALYESAETIDWAGTELASGLVGPVSHLLTDGSNLETIVHRTQ